MKFLKADLSLERLGLETSTYESLLDTVTHIIRKPWPQSPRLSKLTLTDNQWPVNFFGRSRHLSHIFWGVRNLIHFSAASANKSFLLFVSSVAAVGGWDDSDNVPEQPFHDMNVASGIGYGQSKLMSECLLDKATEISGVRSACCRVGIIAGSVEKKLGMWNKHEYIPSVSLIRPSCFILVILKPLS